MEKAFRSGPAAFGGANYLNNFRKMGFEDPVPGKHYDVAFAMFAALDDVDADRRIMLVSDRDTSGVKKRWIKEVFNGDESKFKSFDEGIVLSENTGKGYNDFCSKLKDITGLKFHQEDLNFYFFHDDEKPLPLEERNDRIVNIGRLCTFKGNFDFCKNYKSWCNDKYFMCSYGSNFYDVQHSRIRNCPKLSLTNSGCRLAKYGAFGNQKSWFPETFTEYELVNGVKLHLNYDSEPHKDIFNLFPNYKKDDAFIKLIKQSRFGIFPYPKSMIYSFEFSPLEMIDYGVPIIVMRPFAENFEFCHKTYPLTEEHGFIVLDDPSELTAKCEKFEQNYLENTMKQRNYITSFYKNEEILKNLLEVKTTKFRFGV